MQPRAPACPSRPKKASSAPYDVLDHTADVGLEATGADLAEAFQEAAAGMFSLMVDPATVGATLERRVVVHGSDIEDLLMSWLNELLYLHEADSLVLSDFTVAKLDPAGLELEATVRGEPYDPDRHQLELGVKACTFNGMQVRAGPPACVRVYFDV